MPLTLASTVYSIHVFLIMIYPFARAITTTTSTGPSRVSATSSSITTGTISSAKVASNVVPVSTSDTPFFPYPTSLEPPAQNDTDSRRHHLTKLVVESLFLVIGLSILTSVAIWICYRIRRTNHLRTRLNSTTNRHPPDIPNSFQISRANRLSSSDNTSTTPILLANPFLYPSPYPQLLMHPIYSNAPQIRAMDTDNAGRRLGDGGTSNDHDDELGDKDVLPAYDNSGGPPRYVE